MKFFNKKGDLNLSINAIVILIIAIVFLGLALTFTRNIITGSSDRLIAGVKNVDLQNPADSVHPITFDSEFRIKTGDKRPVKISVYNTGSATNGAPAVLSCDTANVINIQAINTSLPANTEVRFQVLAVANQTKGDFICEIGISGTNMKTQVPVNVYN